MFLATCDPTSSCTIKIGVHILSRDVALPTQVTRQHTFSLSLCLESPNDEFWSVWTFIVFQGSMDLGSDEIVHTSKDLALMCVLSQLRVV